MDGAPLGRVDAHDLLRYRVAAFPRRRHNLLLAPVVADLISLLLLPAVDDDLGGRLRNRLLVVSRRFLRRATASNTELLMRALLAFDVLMIHLSLLLPIVRMLFVLGVVGNLHNASEVLAEAALVIVFGVRLVLRVGRLEFVLLVGHGMHCFLAQMAGDFLIRCRADVTMGLIVLLLQLLSGSRMGGPRGSPLPSKLRGHSHVLAILLLLEIVLLIEKRFTHT